MSGRVALGAADASVLIFRKSMNLLLDAGLSFLGMG
jgi:hypothetical protein